MRNVKTPGLILAILLTMTACSGASPSSEVAAPAPTTTSEVDAAALAEAAKVQAESDAEVAKMQAQALEATLTGITCDEEVFDSLEAAWVTPHESCTATISGEGVTAVQAKALKTANAGNKDPASLSTLDGLYGICADSGAAPFDYLSDGTAEQIAEIDGAMQLCPSHPNRVLIKKYLGKGRAHAKLTAEGRAFFGGTFRVGKEIKAGTYFATDFESCYWERTNRNGDTLDNYFSSGASRAQVTIRSSDYSFNSESCGEWLPVR